MRLLNGISILLLLMQSKSGYGGKKLNTCYHFNSKLIETTEWKEKFLTEVKDRE